MTAQTTPTPAATVAPAPMTRSECWWLVHTTLAEAGLPAKMRRFPEGGWYAEVTWPRTVTVRTPILASEARDLRARLGGDREYAAISAERATADIWRRTA